MINAIKVIRVITALFFMCALLFSYAYLPLTIDVNIEGIGRVGRGTYFYSALGLFLLLHLIAFYLRQYSGGLKMGRYSLLSVHLMAPVMFFAMTLIIGFVTVVNNAQDIEPSRFYYLNFLSAGLVVAWFFMFLFSALKRI